MSADVIDIDTKKIARGRRLRSVRMMTGLSRKAVELNHRISASTLQSWEDAKAGGLTAKGARRAVEAFRKEGIQCAVEWLLHGIGTPPQLTDRVFQGAEPVETFQPQNTEENIVNELLVFRENVSSAVDFVVNDDGMSPFYMPGDTVAGRRRYGEDIASLVGYDCIVETKENQTFLRRLRKGRKPDTYTLVSTNFNTNVDEIVMYDRELFSAAPVVWTRRKDVSIQSD